MRERQSSLADGLMEAKALLDGRYRLDALVRRSQTATVHVATHRNGASAWLKMPIAVAHGELIALEASIANGIGSALSVRDDGITREGLPYLVLDPPDAEALSVLRARARAGTRISLERTMTAGDALISVVSALHGMSYVTGGLAEEDILVFANDEVALLDLHAVSPASPEGLRADNMHLLRILTALVADTEPESLVPMRAALDTFLGGRYADIAVLQAGWRFAFPQPIKAVFRVKSPSIPDLVDSGPRLPVHDTPLTVTLANDEPAPNDTNDTSMVDYLRSAAPSVAPPSRGPQERPVMYDPLSKLAEMPRLVQATSRTPDERRGKRKGPGLLLALIAAPILVVAVVVTLIASSGSSPPREVASSSIMAPPAKQAAAAAPPTAAVAAPAAALELDDDVEFSDESPAAPAAGTVIPTPLATDPPAEGQTAVLRTDSAPAGRPVYLDGKSVGQTPLEATVPCGRHSLQMTAGGAAHAVNLPCGGAKVIRYDRRGRWTVK